MRLLQDKMGLQQFNTMPSRARKRLVTNRIGEWVHLQRTRRNWSREQLAIRANVSYGEICRIEQGKVSDVRLSTLLGLADAFGMELHSLTQEIW